MIRIKRRIKEYEEAEDYAGLINYIHDNSLDINQSPELAEIYRSSTRKYRKEVFGKVEEHINAGDYVSAWSILDTAERILYEDAEIQKKKSEVKLKEISTNVAAYENQQDYAGAICYINENLDVIDNNSEILMKLSSCEQKYRESVRLSAEEVYENEGYQAAVSVINKALNVIQEDEIFLDLKQKYEDLAPVALADINAYMGRLNRSEYIEDNMGNVYQACFVAYGEKEEATYDIGMEYKTIEGTIAVTKADVNDALFYDNYASIVIKGDNKILYEENLLTVSTKPYDISIDISGVTDLTIEMKGKNTNLNYYDGLYVIFADVFLQR